MLSVCLTIVDAQRKDLGDDVLKRKEKYMENNKFKSQERL